MREALFRVGEMVRIRDWDDMAREYGMCGDSINVPFSFTPLMTSLCGMKSVVDDIKWNSAYETYKYFFTDIGWSISEEMLEFCDSPDDVQDTANAITSLFG